MISIPVLDEHTINSRLFFPIPVQPGHSRVNGAIDRTIKLPDGNALGFRLYLPDTPSSVILHFHGTKDFACDYDGIASQYLNLGAAFMVVDYRGYGWGTGKPSLHDILPDAEAVMDALPGILRSTGLNRLPLYVLGRSLGAMAAIHLAERHPGAFAGLIVVSGFVDMASFMVNMGFASDLRSLGQLILLDNRQKISQIKTPLLVIHGEKDLLMPPKFGQALYEAARSKYSKLVLIAEGGHNDLFFYGLDVYFENLGNFMRHTTHKATQEMFELMAFN